MVPSFLASSRLSVYAGRLQFKAVEQLHRRPQGRGVDVPLCAVLLAVLQLQYVSTNVHTISSALTPVGSCAHSNMQSAMPIRAAVSRRASSG